MRINASVGRGPKSDSLTTRCRILTLKADTLGEAEFLAMLRKAVLNVAESGVIALGTKRYGIALERTTTGITAE